MLIGTVGVSALLMIGGGVTVRILWNGDCSGVRLGCGVLGMGVSEALGVTGVRGGVIVGCTLESVTSGVIEGCTLRSVTSGVIVGCTLGSGSMRYWFSKDI